MFTKGDNFSQTRRINSTHSLSSGSGGGGGVAAAGKSTTGSKLNSDRNQSSIHQISSTNNNSYGLDTSELKRWKSEYNLQRNSQEANQQAIAVARVKNFLDNVVSAVRLQSWYRMVRVRRGYDEIMSERHRLKKMCYRNWKIYWHVAKRISFHRRGKFFDAWRDEIQDEKRLKKTIAGFFAICIRRSRLSPQAIMAYFNPGEWDDYIAHEDKTKIRRMVLQRLIDGWKIEARELKIMRYKASQILSRMMRRSKGPMWVKESTLVCFHMWSRYILVKKAYRKGELDPTFKSPYLPQWTKLYKELLLARVKRKRTLEKGQWLTQRRAVSKWKFLMTVDRSKPVTPLAVAVNHYNTVLSTKVLHAWYEHVRARGRSMRFMTRIFYIWKQWAPRHHHLRTSNARATEFVRLARVRRAYTVMETICHTIVGGRTEKIRELRKNFCDRKVLLCAFALLNKNEHVLFIDCWRKWQCYWKARRRWKALNMHFNYEWFSHKSKEILRAWRQYTAHCKNLRKMRNDDDLLSVDSVASGMDGFEDDNDSTTRDLLAQLTAAPSAVSLISPTPVSTTARHDTDPSPDHIDSLVLYQQEEQRTESGKKSIMSGFWTTANTLFHRARLDTLPVQPTAVQLFFLCLLWSRYWPQTEKYANMSSEHYSRVLLNDILVPGKETHGGRLSAEDREGVSNLEQDDHIPASLMHLMDSNDANSVGSLTTAATLTNPLLDNRANDPIYNHDPLDHAGVRRKVQYNIVFAKMWDDDRQTRLQSSLSEWQLNKTMLPMLAEQPLYESKHLHELSKHIGDHYLTVFTLMLMGSVCFLAERIVKRDKDHILLRTHHPVNAFLLGSQINRWEQGDLTTRERSSLSQELFVTDMNTSRFRTIYLWKLLFLHYLDQRCVNMAKGCRSLPYGRKVEEEVVEVLKRKKVAKMVSVHHAISTSLGVPLPWTIDERVDRLLPVLVLDQHTKNIFTTDKTAAAAALREEKSIYQVLREYILINGKLAREAKALRGPLMERDRVLLINGVMRQARSDYLALRKECVHPDDLEALEAKKQKQLEKDAKAQAKAEAKAAKKRKTRRAQRKKAAKKAAKAAAALARTNSKKAKLDALGKSTSSFASEELNDDDEQKDLGTESDAEETSTQGGEESEMESESEPNTARGSETEEEGGSASQGQEEDEDDGEEDEDLRETSKSSSGKDKKTSKLTWDKSFDKVKTSLVRELIDQFDLAEEDEIQEEAAFHERVNLLTQNAVFLETWKPNCWSHEQGVRDALAQRLKRELRLVLKRVFHVFQHEEALGPLQYAAIRQTHPGLGLYIVDSVLCDETPEGHYRHSPLWTVLPKDYWSFRQVRDRLSQEQAIVDVTVRSLTNQCLETELSNDTKDEDIAQYQKQLKALRKQVVDIANKVHTKDALDKQQRKSKVNQIKKQDKFIAECQREMQNVENKLFQGQQLFMKNDLNAAFELLKPPPPLDADGNPIVDKKKKPNNNNAKGNKKGKKQLEDDSHSPQEIMDLMEHHKKEMDEWQEKSVESQRKRDVFVKELSALDVFADRANKLLKQFAEQKFYELLDLQTFATQTAKAVFVADDNDKQTRTLSKLNSKYAQALKYFFEEVLVPRGVLLTKQAEQKRFQDMMARPSGLAMTSQFEGGSLKTRSMDFSAALSGSMSSRGSPMHAASIALANMAKAPFARNLSEPLFAINGGPAAVAAAAVAASTAADLPSSSTPKKSDAKKGKSAKSKSSPGRASAKQKPLSSGMKKGTKADSSAASGGKKKRATIAEDEIMKTPTVDNEDDADDGERHTDEQDDADNDDNENVHDEDNEDEDEDEDEDAEGGEGRDMEEEGHGHPEGLLVEGDVDNDLACVALPSTALSATVPLRSKSFSSNRLAQQMADQMRPIGDYNESLASPVPSAPAIDRELGRSLTVDEEIELLHYNSPENIAKREEELRRLAEKQAEDAILQDIRMTIFDEYWSSFPRKDTDAMELEKLLQSQRDAKEKEQQALAAAKEAQAAAAAAAAAKERSGKVVNNRSVRTWKSIGEAYWREKQRMVEQWIRRQPDARGLDPEAIASAVNIQRKDSVDPLDVEFDLVPDDILDLLDAPVEEDGPMTINRQFVRPFIDWDHPIWQSTGPAAPVHSTDSAIPSRVPSPQLEPTTTSSPPKPIATNTVTTHSPHAVHLSISMKTLRQPMLANGEIPKSDIAASLFDPEASFYQDNLMLAIKNKELDVVTQHEAFLLGEDPPVKFSRDVKNKKAPKPVDPFSQTGQSEFIRIQEGVQSRAQRFTINHDDGDFSVASRCSDVFSRGGVITLDERSDSSTLLAVRKDEEIEHARQVRLRERRELALRSGIPFNEDIGEAGDGSPLLLPDKQDGGHRMDNENDDDDNASLSTKGSISREVSKSRLVPPLRKPKSDNSKYMSGRGGGSPSPDDQRKSAELTAEERQRQVEEMKQKRQERIAAKAARAQQRNLDDDLSVNTDDLSDEDSELIFDVNGEAVTSSPGGDLKALGDVQDDANLAPDLSSPSASQSSPNGIVAKSEPAPGLDGKSRSQRFHDWKKSRQRPSFSATTGTDLLKATMQLTDNTSEKMDQFKATMMTRMNSMQAMLTRSNSQLMMSPSRDAVDEEEKARILALSLSKPVATKAPHALTRTASQQVLFDMKKHQHEVDDDNSEDQELKRLSPPVVHRTVSEDDGSMTHGDVVDRLWANFAHDSMYSSHRFHPLEEFSSSILSAASAASATASCIAVKNKNGEWQLVPSHIAIARPNTSMSVSSVPGTAPIEGGIEDPLLVMEGRAVPITGHAIDDQESVASSESSHKPNVDVLQQRLIDTLGLTRQGSMSQQLLATARSEQSLGDKDLNRLVEDFRLSQEANAEWQAKHASPFSQFHIQQQLRRYDQPISFVPSTFRQNQPAAPLTAPRPGSASSHQKVVAATPTAAIATAATGGGGGGGGGGTAEHHHNNKTTATAHRLNFSDDLHSNHTSPPISRQVSHDFASLSNSEKAKPIMGLGAVAGLKVAIPSPRKDSVNVTNKMATPLGSAKVVTVKPNANVVAVTGIDDAHRLREDDISELQDQLRDYLRSREKVMQERQTLQSPGPISGRLRSRESLVHNSRDAHDRTLNVHREDLPRSPATPLHMKPHEVQQELMLATARSRVQSPSHGGNTSSGVNILTFDESLGSDFEGIPISNSIEPIVVRDRAGSHDFWIGVQTTLTRSSSPSPSHMASANNNLLSSMPNTSQSTSNFDVPVGSRPLSTLKQDRDRAIGPKVVLKAKKLTHPVIEIVPPDQTLQRAIARRGGLDTDSNSKHNHNNNDTDDMANAQYPLRKAYSLSALLSNNNNNGSSRDRKMDPFQSATVALANETLSGTALKTLTSVSAVPTADLIEELEEQVEPVIYGDGQDAMGPLHSKQSPPALHQPKHTHSMASRQHAFASARSNSAAAIQIIKEIANGKNSSSSSSHQQQQQQQYQTVPMSGSTANSITSGGLPAGISISASTESVGMDNSQHWSPLKSPLHTSFGSLGSNEFLQLKAPQPIPSVPSTQNPFLARHLNEANERVDLTVVALPVSVTVKQSRVGSPSAKARPHKSSSVNNAVANGGSDSDTAAAAAGVAVDHADKSKQPKGKMLRHVEHVSMARLHTPKMPQQESTARARSPFEVHPLTAESNAIHSSIPTARSATAMTDGSNIDDDLDDEEDMEDELRYLLHAETDVDTALRGVGAQPSKNLGKAAFPMQLQHQESFPLASKPYNKPSKSKASAKMSTASNASKNPFHGVHRKKTMSSSLPPLASSSTPTRAAKSEIAVDAQDGVSTMPRSLSVHALPLLREDVPDGRDLSKSLPMLSRESSGVSVGPVDKGKKPLNPSLEGARALYLDMLQTMST